MFEVSIMANGLANIARARASAASVGVPSGRGGSPRKEVPTLTAVAAAVSGAERWVFPAVAEDPPSSSKRFDIQPGS